MIVAVLLLFIGLVAGLARGGKLENISKMEISHPWTVFVGLSIQIGGDLISTLVNPRIREDGRGIVILGTSYLFLIVFVVLNRSLHGIVFIGAGLAFNLLVIGLNSGMPVSLDAARAAGANDTAEYLGTAIKHRVMGPDTRLWFLGDIIPLPYLRKVISIGDVVLGVGVALLVERSVRYQPRRLTATKEA